MGDLETKLVNLVILGFWVTFVIPTETSLFDPSAHCSTLLQQVFRSRTGFWINKLKKSITSKFEFH